MAANTRASVPRLGAEGEALRTECMVLEEKLVRLVVERTRLLDVVAPALDARFRVALGSLPVDVVSAECEVRRLRRKIELLRAAWNRGARPDLVAVEAQLDVELAEWRARVREELARLQRAEAHLEASPLSLDEARELRALFRRLARRCHPDANPAGGAAARRLWLQAAAAYGRGDLDGLRTLMLLADRLPDEGEGVPESGLRERRDALGASVQRLLSELDAMYGRYPLSIRVQIADPVWLDARRKALAARRDALADERVLVEAALADALEACADA